MNKTTKILIGTGSMLVSALLIQGIRAIICKANVTKALLDPTLQNKYIDCTTNGFNKTQLDSSRFYVSAIVKKWPFAVELAKWSDSDKIYTGDPDDSK